MKTIEFRVRPVTRYNLTRYESGPDYGGCETIAEFGNWMNAHDVAVALQASEPGATYIPYKGEHVVCAPATSVSDQDVIAVQIGAEIERQRVLREGTTD